MGFYAVWLWLVLGLGSGVAGLLLIFERVRMWGGVLAGEIKDREHYSSLGYDEVEPHVSVDKPRH